MPQSTSLRRLRYPLVAAALLLLAAVGVAMIWSIRSFASSTEWVRHTHEVIGEIEALRASIHTVEATARGYRLSGQASFKAEFEDASGLPGRHAAALVARVADNPQQQARARALVPLVDSRVAHLRRTIALFDAGRPDLANRLMAGEVKRRIGARVDGLLDRMLSVERGLLESRSAETADRVAWLTGVVVVGIVLPLLVILALLRSLWREGVAARSLEREARGALERLEASSAEREALAEQRRILAQFARVLHSCQTRDEALDLAGNVLAQLVPGASGTCHLMRASRNGMEMRPVFGPQRSSADSPLDPAHCWAMRRGLTHAHDPLHPIAVCEHVRQDGLAAHGSLCVPLAVQGEVLGLMHVTESDRRAFAPDRAAIVESVAEHLAVLMHSLALRESLRMQSLRDALTGLYNRRYLEESLPREVERCRRRGRPMAALMLDVDHFKRFNDAHGHAAGDALLRHVAEVISGLTRDEDIACRFGGEEFTVLMPEAGRAQAAARAEQIRAAIAGATISHMRKTLGPVTISIGVAELGDTQGPAALLLSAADKALYAAKAQGRDRVVVANAPAPAEPPVAARGLVDA